MRCTRQRTLFSAFVLVAALAASARAEVIGDIELLKQVAEKNRDNYGAISTWSATMDMTTTSCEPFKRNYTHHTVAEFIYSRPTNAIRWSQNTPHESSVKIDSNTIPSTSSRSYLLIDDLMFDYTDIWSADSQKTYRLMIEPPGTSANQSAHIDMNPLRTLTDHGEPWYDRLMFFYNTAHTGKHCLNYYVWEFGSLIILEGRATPPQKDYVRYVFDMNRGGNLVESLVQSAKETWQTTMTYDCDRFIFIPASCTRTCTIAADPATASQPTTTSPIIAAMRQSPAWETQQIRWTNNRVNVDVPASEFTLAKIGVKPTDTFHDPRTDKRTEAGPFLNDPQVLKEIALAVKIAQEKKTAQSATSQPTTSQPAGKF